MTESDLLTAMQDMSLPSRKIVELEYSGLFGPDAAFEPMRIYSSIIVLLLLSLMAVVLYRECISVRKRQGYAALYGHERT